ncbi:MAG: T9SS type A sorting domain-containing protein [Candidatus Cloacimonetes bacterium]|nr:T9SS type A sorting domain-containing protein [Candidatus Cloacimonadota bacterium]
MKGLVFSLIFIMLATTLLAFDEPVAIENYTHNAFLINYEKNTLVVNDQVWLLYYLKANSNEQAYLKMAKERTDGGFDVLLLDSFVISDYEIEKLDCTFTVQNDNVTIFYKKTTTNLTDLSIFKIHSENLMENWTYEGEQAFQDIQIVRLLSNDDEQVLMLLQDEYLPEAGICELYYEYRCGGEFKGADVLWGPVHSKDDIYIHQQGSGTNNGWPTFHDMVSTEGLIIDAATGQSAILTAPIDEIFLGGYRENAPDHFTLPESSGYVYENGFDLSTSRDRDLIYVKLEGTTATCRYANISYTLDTLTVYNSFPDELHNDIEVGDSLWTNIVEIPVIEWDEMTFIITVLNCEVIVHCDMWIEGSVSGFQGWYGTENIYITDDLLYGSTEPGEEPDLLDPDRLWLCSEKNLFIKYKNYDPDSGTIKTDNCDGLYIYGILTALGMPEQEEYEWSSGGLRTEYLHPHGSTPEFTYTYPGGEEWEIQYPDLYKYVYPDGENFTGDTGFIMHSNSQPAGYATCGYPYEDPAYGNGMTTPYGTDFPWYNPVYPESSEDMVFDRGTIELYGSLYERRFQEIKCNGQEGEHHQDNIWEPENGLFGGTHLASGYEINYHYDHRAAFQPFLRGIAETLVDSNYTLTILTSTDGGTTFEAQVEQEYSNRGLTNWQPLQADLDGNTLALIYSTTSGYRYNILDLETSELETCDPDIFYLFGKAGSIKIIDNMFYFDDGRYVYSSENLTEPLVELFYSDYYGFRFLNDMPINWNIDRVLDEFTLTLYQAINWIFYEIDEIELESTDELDFSRLRNAYLTFDSHLNGKLFLNIEAIGNKCLYLLSGPIDDLSPAVEEDIPALLNLIVYPNPFYLNKERSSLNIAYTLPQNETGSLALFNLKGQELEKWQINGSGSISFEPSALSSGLYFVKIEGQNNSRYQKFLIIR